MMMALGFRQAAGNVSGDVTRHQASAYVAARLRRMAAGFFSAVLFAGAGSGALAQSSTTTVSATAGFGIVYGTASASFSTGNTSCQPSEEENYGEVSVGVPNGQYCNSTPGDALYISCQSNFFVTPGVYAIGATYSGYNGSDPYGNTCSIPGSSATVNVTVPQSDTTLAVQWPTGPLQSGQMLILPIVVAGMNQPGYGGPIPTGVVTLYYGSQVLASGQLPPSSGSNGTQSNAFTFSLPTKGIAPGQYSVQVKYPGDVNYEASASSTFTVTIEKAQLPTSTVLTVAPNPIVAGETATLSADVTQTGNVAPTGMVTFLVDGATVDSASVSNGAASVAAPTTGIAPGKYSVIALYSGDQFNLPSTSAPVSVTVVATSPTTTTVAVSPASVVEGQTTQITATVTQQIGNVVPTGTVALTANGAALATIPLVNGVATLEASTAGIAPGSYDVVGTYSGNSTAEMSSSQGVTVTILKPATVNVVASPNPVTQGSVTTLIAGVVDGNGNPVTSGTVNFSYAGSLLGSAMIGSGVTAQLPISTSAFAVGTYVITATYTGSETIPAASGTVSLVVQ